MSSGGPSSSAGTATVTHQGSSASSSQAPTLHLILQPRPQNHVTWTEDTVDNEFLNRRKSKKCCIFKKPRAFGESSSSSGSDDNGSAKPIARRRKNPSDRMCPFGQPADRDGDEPGPDGGSSGGGGGPISA